MGLDGGAIDIGGNNDVALFLLGMDGRWSRHTVRGCSSRLSLVTVWYVQYGLDKCMDCEDVVGVGTIDMGRQQYVGMIIGTYSAWLLQ